MPAKILLPLIAIDVIPTVSGNPLFERFQLVPSFVLIYTVAPEPLTPATTTEPLTDKLPTTEFAGKPLFD